jgi:hypothetical protein
MSRFHFLELFLGRKLAELHPQSDRVHILLLRRAGQALRTKHVAQCEVSSARPLSSRSAGRESVNGDRPVDCEAR